MLQVFLSILTFKELLLYSFCERFKKLFTMIKLTTSGEVTLRLSIVMIALVSIAVILRFLSKRKTKAGSVVEDWLIVIPLCLFYAYVAVLLQGESDFLTVSRC